MLEENIIYRQKKQLSAPKTIDAAWWGRMPSGNKKYEQLKYKGVFWADLSKAIRKGKSCKKCGTKRKLTCDHFHPMCYKWIKQFFNPRKIQILCADCHAKIPNGPAAKTQRWSADKWKKFVY